MKRVLFAGLAFVSVAASLTVACGDDDTARGPGGTNNVALDGSTNPSPTSTTPKDPPPGDLDGGDSGSGEGGAGTDSGDGGDGGDGGDPSLATPDWYVDPAAGSDANDGKSAAGALKTLCKAKDLALDGQVIELAAGTYDHANQRPVNWTLSGACGPAFAKRVHVRGPTAGEALVSVAMSFSAGGSLRGIKVTTERNADPGESVKSRGTIAVTGGTFEIREVSFGDVFSSPAAKAAALTVSGNANVTLRPGGLPTYLTQPVPDGKALIFAFVSAPGALTVEGGTFEDSLPNNPDTFCAPLFEGSGNLTLKGGVVARHKGTVLRATGMTASFESGTVLENRVGKFNIGCSTTIGMLGTVGISLRGTTIKGGFTGIETEGNAAGTLDISSGTVIEGGVSAGIDVAGAGALAFKLRGSTVKSSGIGIRIGGAIVADLGKSGAGNAGGNILKDSVTTAVNVTTATTTVDAVGNTWNANDQGADAQGNFAAELKTGPITTGSNIRLAGAAQKIQL